MAENKILVYVLEKDGIKAVHFDIDGVCDSMKMELDNMPDEDILETKFTISSKMMTEKEIDAMPEFDGF